MNQIEKDPRAVKTSKNKIAYLFGNGINRTNNNNRDNNRDKYEWGNLLEDLNKEFAYGEIQNLRRKQFPFVYDEIVNYSVRNSHKNEKEIKEFIQKGLNNLKINSRYDKLAKLRCNEILTTNYDYLFEKGLQSNWTRQKFEPTSEKKYSLFRNQETTTNRIWHIHGEQDMRNSILLGFRHYIDYSSQVKLRGYQTVKKLKGDKTELKNSWVDLFFTHEINIVGLGMKFTEYPLWWLLAYRHFKNTTDRLLDVNNEINYVIPAFSLKNEPDLQDTLKAYNIKTKPIDVDDQDYDGFYKAILNNEK